MLSVFYNAPKITSGALSDGDNRDGDMLMLNINRSLSRSAFSPFCRTWLMEKKKELGVMSRKEDCVVQVILVGCQLCQHLYRLK
jgi:hypothetical protein